MEANSIGQSGDADPPGQPPEEEKSYEEIALIHAAMMADLGVHRVDALPLDDRGGDRIPVSMPIQKQVEDDPNDPTARWRNIQFDDITPADAGRDPMYNGQLYRLRKQAMEAESNQHGPSDRQAMEDESNQHGPSGRQATKDDSNQQRPSGRGGRSLARGRGGGANRGGNGGRGGSSRGGHDLAMEAESNHHGPFGRGGRSLGRGRGGGANRGGNGGRGGSSRGGPSRGGSDSVNTEHRSELTSSSGRTWKPFFTKARRGGMNRHAHFGTSVTPHLAEAAGAPAVSSKEEWDAVLRDAVLTRQRQRLANKAGSSGNPQARTAAPKPAIAGQDAFPPYAGLTESTSAPQERSRTSSSSDTSRQDYAPPVRPPVVRFPQAPQTVDIANVQSQQESHDSADEKSAGIHNIIAKESQPQTLPKGAVGLAGSRWATPGVADVAQAEPPQPVLKANTHATKSGTVCKQELVKISKDGCASIRGRARLLENKSPKGTYFTMELDIDGKIILSQDILDVDIFSCENRFITYRPQRNANGSTLLPSNTWQLEFLMPYQTETFFKRVTNVRNWDLAPDVNALAQPVTGSAAVAPSQQPKSIEQTTAPLAVSERSESLLDRDVRSTAASVGSDPMNISDVTEILDENVGPSGSPRRPASSEWPLTQPITDRISVVLPEGYQSGDDLKISTQAWSGTEEVADVDPLVSFGHDDPESVAPWFRTLLNMDDTNLIQSTFDHFDKKPDGPFLDQLSTIVAKENVPPASRLTGEEVLSSVKYQEAAESLVGGYLCQSATFVATFAKMPDMYIIQYTSEKARKVLEKAVAHREGQNMTKHDLAPQPSPAFEQSESGPNIPHYRAEPFMVQDSKLPKVAVDADNLKGSGSRITYSPAYLLSLQQNASRPKSTLFSGDLVDCVLPQQNEVMSNNPANIPIPRQVQLWHLNPANNIGTNGDGIPTVAGRDELSRQPSYDDAGSPVVKQTTSVGAWQSCSVTESGDPTEHLRQLPTDTEDPTNQFKPASAQKPAVQKSSWSNEGPSTLVKTEPVMTPPKLANTCQKQETDMTLWNAILNAPKDTKQDPSRIRAFSKSKQQSFVASARDIGHVPTNSECDRLASTFEGLALSKELNPEPSTLKVQPVPVSDASIGVEQPSLLERPQSASAFAMFEKIKESLNAPLKLVSRPNSMLPSTPVPSVTDTAKSNTGSIPPTQKLAAVEAASTQDWNAENPATFQPLRKGVTAVPHPHPASYSHPEASANYFLSSKDYLPTPHAQSPAVYLPSGYTQLSTKPSTTSSTAEVQPKIVVKAESESRQISDPISTQIPNLETITNKDLKGTPGLQASRWANPVDHAPAPRAPPIRFTPIIPIHPQHHYGHAQQQAPQTYGNDYASPPSFQNPHAPMMSTPRKQENVPFPQQTPPVPKFGLHRGHKRNDSMATALNFSPSSSPFTATRGRGSSAISPQDRTALSPVRQGENVQANLQSHPNTFLTGRPPNANE